MKKKQTKKPPLKVLLKHCIMVLNSSNKARLQGISFTKIMPQSREPALLLYYKTRLLQRALRFPVHLLTLKTSNSYLYSKKTQIQEYESLWATPIPPCVLSKLSFS